LGHIKCIENVECGIWTQTCLGLGFFRLDSTIRIALIEEVLKAHVLWIIEYPL
jgi:hypothetical protein